MQGDQVPDAELETWRAFEKQWVPQLKGKIANTAEAALMVRKSELREANRGNEADALKNPGLPDASYVAEMLFDFVNNRQVPGGYTTVMHLERENLPRRMDDETIDAAVRYLVYKYNPELRPETRISEQTN